MVASSSIFEKRSGSLNLRSATKLVPSMDECSSDNNREADFQQQKYRQDGLERKPMLGFKTRKGVAAGRDLWRVLAVVDVG